MKPVTVLALLLALFGGALAAQDTNLNPAQYRLALVASGFARPLYVTGAGDGSGRLFVVEQAGRVWIVRDGATLPVPFLDISPLVSTSANERGLLGLAFHPDYTTTGVFYVHYSARSPKATPCWLATASRPTTLTWPTPAAPR
jgi:hypothetical protein